MDQDTVNKPGGPYAGNFMVVRKGLCGQGITK